MTPTAPPVDRTAMPARPWLGLWRSLPHLLAGGDKTVQRAPWQDAASQRRRFLLAALVVLAGSAAVLGDMAGLQPTWALVLAVVLFTWVGLGLVTALMGAWVMVRGDRYALALSPAQSFRPLSRQARTAIVMPICNEDIASAFGCLRATCESLAASGALGLFDIYVLSDTTDPALRAAEVEAWKALRAELGDADDGSSGRIFYRLRRRRSERKAGNVADFCRRWGSRYRYMIVLDADSTMDSDTLVGLVRLMEENPRAGIVQTLPQSIGHTTLHARAQQFGSRVTGRLFALGMAYWQLGDSHYWGHNAILRVAPFMAHCRIAPLRGFGGLSGSIMSHDFVEAALMRRAGYEVWLAPQLTGSWEQTPPNLLDELQRDRRWCQGNLQNARLIVEPGWRPAHRAMFITGALSYTVAPMWLALATVGALGLVAPAASASTSAGIWLWGLTIALLLTPRLLGLAAIFARREQAQHGGTARMLTSSLLETLLSAIQAPLRMLAHAGYVLGALTGLRIEWRSPPRDARAVRWTDAMQRVGLSTLPFVLAAVIAIAHGVPASWHLWLLLIPLALAVPFVVATGSESIGAHWRRWNLFSVVDELAPPRILRRAAQNRDLAVLQPRTVDAPAPGWAWPRIAYGAGLCALVVAGLMPRTAVGPEPDAMAWSVPQTIDWVTARVSTVGDALTAEPRRAGVRRSAPTSAATTSASYLPAVPARYIDDEVRQRASEAVARALLAEG